MRALIKRLFAREAETPALRGYCTVCGRGYAGSSCPVCG